MRVSFIVPLFNCLPLTQAMLASLQTTIPSDLTHEILLVDDGSTDGTRDWLKTLAEPPFRILLNERNLGYAGANNHAASIASGELLVLLNNDLELTPGWLEPMLALHSELPKPGAIGNIQLNASTGAVDHAGIYVTVKGKPEHDVRVPRCLCSDGPGRTRVPRVGLGVSPEPSDPFPARRREEAREARALPGLSAARSSTPLGASSRECASTRFKISPAVTGACLLIDRNHWNELGGFDPQFINGGEDIDLCFRAHKAGFTNAVALRSVIRHHVSASPGRKQHDEHNAYRLTLRWKTELIRLGARAWCKYHVRHTPYREVLSLPAILFYLLRILRTPPTAALRGVGKNIDHSLIIWTKQFG